MAEVAAEDMEEEVDEVEEDTAKEIAEGAEAHMKWNLFTCYFENSEWAALSNDTRESITEDPLRTKLLANKKRRTASSVSAQKDNENWLISQIIMGFKTQAETNMDCQEE